MLVVLAFALWGRNQPSETTDDALDIGIIFSTMAILTMITHPANMVMTIYPRVIAARANVKRVQNISPQYADSYGGNAHDEPSVLLENASFQADTLGPTILFCMNIHLRSSLTICIGPIGSGKTNLVKAVLGELQLKHGNRTSTCRTVGLYEQQPWLPDVTLQRAIVGLHDRPCERYWYEQVVRACCLEIDIQNSPYGHQTKIGHRGNKLSGGQRQRVVSHGKYPMLFLP
jgi:ATP-binding cassette subfamily C (CFTR/MRP) protein 1